MSRFSTAGLLVGLLAVCLATVIGCAAPFDSDVRFHLRYKDANFPVWIRGNTASQTFIVYLHGGPGGTGFLPAINDFFSPIEERFAVVYWDQRASGHNEGKSSGDLLNLAQFVEDTGIVISYIEQSYPGAEVFLMGHSWGGLLGSAFLLEPGNQTRISGWIEVDGGHNLGNSAFLLSREYVVDYAQTKVAANDTGWLERRHWREALQWYAGRTTWSDATLETHATYVEEAGGYVRDEELTHPATNLEKKLFSSLDFAMVLFQQTSTNTATGVIGEVDFTERLFEISIPALVVWGRHDGILPVELGEQAAAALGHPDTRLVVFEDSGHLPHWEERESFCEEVVAFVDRWR